MYDAAIVRCGNDEINNIVHSSVAIETRTLSHTADSPMPPAPSAAREFFFPNDFSPGHYLVRWVRVKG